MNKITDGVLWVLWSGKAVNSQVRAFLLIQNYLSKTNSRESHKGLTVERVTDKMFR